jgi:hypothetical protein
MIRQGQLWPNAFLSLYKWPFKAWEKREGEKEMKRIKNKIKKGVENFGKNFLTPFLLVV